MDTFRLHQVLLDAGGGTAAVYGYGFGFAIWATSISLTLISSTLRQTIAHSNLNMFYYPFVYRVAPIIFTSLIIIGALGAAIENRMHGSKQEVERLAKNSVMFKRGSICSESVMVPKHQFEVDKPIEVVNIYTNYSGLHWFSTPENLLRWGIPKVRMKGIDYFNSGTEEFILTGVPAKGPASAIITTESKYDEKNMGRIRSITISSSDKKITSFHQVWLPEVKGKDISCPRYMKFGNHNEQPLKSILSSFNFDPKYLDKQNQNLTRIDSIVESTTKEKFSGLKTDRFKNYQCPESTGIMDLRKWQKIREESGISSSVPSPFIVGDVYYFAKNRFDVTCVDDSVYMYKSRKTGKNRKDISFSLIKRNINTFSELWRAYTVIENIGSEINRSRFILLSVEEGEKSAIFKFYENSTGSSYAIKVNLSELSN